tara:strand:+ start:16806 stop:17324 length:519 start_codon:yes stop_codon:yes gene_type:complete
VVEPIGEGQRLQVLERTEECLQWGEALFGRRFRRIPVLFDLSGTTAGMFKRHGRRCQIRYNPWIFGKYFHENLRDTVPHEVAHYLVHAVYGDRGIKPHGAEWRALMHNFGADPGVTFNLDLRDIPQRRQRTHPYRCGCQEHELSSTRHNRVQRGRGRYQCVKCAGVLVHAPA